MLEKKLHPSTKILTKNIVYTMISCSLWNGRRYSFRGNYHFSRWMRQQVRRSLWNTVNHQMWCMMGGQEIRIHRQGQALEWLSLLFWGMTFVINRNFSRQGWRGAGWQEGFNPWAKSLPNSGLEMNVYTDFRANGLHMCIVSVCHWSAYSRPLPTSLYCIVLFFSFSWNNVITGKAYF